jgi:hypothetical protein
MKEQAATFRMKGRVVLRHIGEDRLLVPVSGDVARENCVFPLNNTGEFIWERLSRGESVEQVARGLAVAFEVPWEAALADCQEYAGELVSQQLLEGVAP